MSYSRGHLVETAPPVSEPVTLEEIKAHLRIASDAEDEYLMTLIMAARQMVEKFTSLSLIQRSYSLFLDAWPCASDDGWWDGVREGAKNAARAHEVWLPKPPLLAVTQVLLADQAGIFTVYSQDNYYVDQRGVPGSIVLKDGSPTPMPGITVNGIEIRFTAGYGTQAQAVPTPLRQAVKLVAARLFETRGDEDNGQVLQICGAAALMQPYRQMGLL